MDTISIFVGMLVGVIATAVAVELGLKKLFRPPSRTKMTAAWRLEDFEAPVVVAMDATSTVYPKGARVVTAGGADPRGFRDRDFRRNPNARGNFLIDRSQDKALLFLGPVQDGTLALSTVDSELVGRLRAEHRRLWETGEAYVEEIPLAEVVGRQGVSVRTRGQVVEVVPYRERHLMRVTDAGETIGVLVDASLDLVGQSVVVTGRVSRGQSGYTIVDADEVRVVRKATRGAAQEVTVPTKASAPAKATPAPAVTPTHLKPEPTKERVVRIQGKRRAAEPEPEMEFEATEPEPPAPSLAEQGRKKAKVVIHR